MLSFFIDCTKYETQKPSQYPLRNKSHTSYADVFNSKYLYDSSISKIARLRMHCRIYFIDSNESKEMH